MVISKFGHIGIAFDHQVSHSLAGLEQRLAVGFLATDPTQTVVASAQSHQMFQPFGGGSGGYLLQMGIELFDREIV